MYGTIEAVRCSKTEKREIKFKDLENNSLWVKIPKSFKDMFDSLKTHDKIYLKSVSKTSETKTCTYTYHIAKEIIKI